MWKVSKSKLLIKMVLYFTKKIINHKNIKEICFYLSESNIQSHITFKLYPRF